MNVYGVSYRRWSGGDWGIGRVGKGEEAREMRQSAWLKRLDLMLRAKRLLSQAVATYMVLSSNQADDQKPDEPDSPMRCGMSGECTRRASPQTFACVEQM